MDLMTSTEYVYVILVLNDVFIEYIVLKNIQKEQKQDGITYEFFSLKCKKM